jgi:predicted metal-dependent enzyme (double-stranded beta helix superfamily)
MVKQNWLVTDEGDCQGTEMLSSTEELNRPYRLYRFLTELEDLLITISDDRLRLKAILPRVRKLLTSADWLEILPMEPDPKTGWEVLMLYDEPLFPLTVQLVAWAPGMKSPIHNHGCWGLVALLSGQEKNTFWQRSPTVESPDRIEPVGDRLLVPGDILCLMPDAIHHIEAMGNSPAISFNLYGETDYSQRFEFDPIQARAKNF